MNNNLEPLNIPTPESVSSGSSSDKSDDNEQYLLSFFCIINDEWYPIKIFPSLSDMSAYLYDKYRLRYSAKKLNYLIDDKKVRVHIVLRLLP